METSVTQYTSAIRKKAVANEYSGMNYTTAQKAALTIRALDHTIRKRIIDLLEENNRMQVSEIYVKLNLQQAVASQHLAILRKAKIVNVEYTKHDCRVKYYSLNRARISEISTFSKTLVS